MPSSRQIRRRIMARSGGERQCDDAYRAGGGYPGLWQARRGQEDSAVQESVCRPFWTK
jgi:hypothetical protein